MSILFNVSPCCLSRCPSSSFVMNMPKMHFHCEMSQNTSWQKGPQQMKEAEQNIGVTVDQRSGWMRYVSVLGVIQHVGTVHLQQCRMSLKEICIWWPVAATDDTEFTSSEYFKNLCFSNKWELFNTVRMRRRRRKNKQTKSILLYTIAGFEYYTFSFFILTSSRPTFT